MSRHTRHRAREFALQALYQWQLTGNPLSAIEHHMAGVAGFDQAEPEFFATLLHGAIAERELLERDIAPFLDREADDVSPVERGLLLLGAYELKHCPETPFRVVINEYIELAKHYGGTDGHKFVNGILDRLAARLRPDEPRDKPPTRPGGRKAGGR